MTRKSLVIPILAALLSTTACSKLAPAKVADGSARLSVAAVATLISAIAADKKCGFESEQVKNSVSVQALTSDTGVAEYIVNDCEIDFGDKTIYSTDCNGESTVLRGRVFVSARQKRKGIITNSKFLPVVPDGEDSVTIEITRLRFDNFELAYPQINQKIRFSQGEAQASVSIHLAKNSDIGFCSEPTPNLSVHSLTIQNAQITLPGPTGDFTEVLDDAKLRAQVGTWGGNTNLLEGTVVLHGRVMPVNNDEKGLMPDYSDESFERSFLCGEKALSLHLPISYRCDIRRTLAENAARLVLFSTGTLAQDLGYNTDCGFEAKKTRDNYNLFLGGYWGFFIARLETESCKIGYDGTKLHDDNCFAPGTSDYQQTFVSGHAIVDADMIVRGMTRLSRTQFYPSSPSSPDDMMIDVRRALPQNYMVYTLKTGQALQTGSLLLKDGELSAKVYPVLGAAMHSPHENPEEQCQFVVSTPHVRFENVQLKNANVELQVAYDGELLRFPMFIKETSLYGRNGVYRNKGNYIFGSIVANNRRYDIEGPVNNDEQQDWEATPLDTNYTDDLFDQAYACRTDESYARKNNGKFLAWMIPHDDYVTKCLTPDPKDRQKYEKQYQEVLRIEREKGIRITIGYFEKFDPSKYK